MIPVCIPTYKHPKCEYIDRVKRSKEFETEKYKHPMFYFIYDIDWDSFNYDNYKDKFEELHFVKVSYDQYKTAMKMRLFIKNYMTEKGYDFFFMFDNDVGLKAMKYDYDIRRMITIGTNDFLDIWENMSEIHDYAITRPSSNWIAIKHDIKPEKEFKFCKNPVQVVLFNNKLMNEHNINYTGDTTVSEDTEIAVDCLIKGLKIGEMNNYFVNNLQSMGNGEAGWYNLNSQIDRTWEKLKHTGYLTLKTDKKGNPKIVCNEKDMSSVLFPSESEVNLWE